MTAPIAFPAAARWYIDGNKYKSMNTKTNFRDWFQKLMDERTELTFIITGVLIFIVTVWYLAGSISFLVDSFNYAFNVNVKGAGQQASFDLKGASDALRQNGK